MIDPADCRLVRELKHASPLIAARYDPTGRYLFAAAQDSTVQRWDLDTGTATALVGHVSWVRGAMAFRARDGLLVTADYAGEVICWDSAAAEPKPLRRFAAHVGWCRAAAVSPDGTLLATCGNDGLVKLWSPDDGKLVRTFEGHGCHVYNVAFHPSGERLASADLKGVVKDWDVKAGTAVREMDAKPLYKYDPGFKADIGGVRGMAFSPDGSLLACSGITEVTNAFAGVGKPLVVLLDWASGKAKLQLKPKDAFQGTAWNVVFHPDGFVIAAGGGSGGQVWFWPKDAAQSTHTVGLKANARDLALRPDGRQLAVPSPDGLARLYTLQPLVGPTLPPAPKAKK